jgi:hypothetical protein
MGYLQRVRVHQSHPRAQKRLRTALCGASAPGLRRRDGFADTAFAKTARFIKVSALIRSARAVIISSSPLKAGLLVRDVEVS